MHTSVRRTAAIALTLTVIALAGPAPASAQGNGATVSTTEVEDSFFNPCTREVVDRRYTQHVTRRKNGDDYVLAVNWSNGKGVGQTTGDTYTMNWKYQQMNHSSDGGGQQSFTYRVKTTVHAQGSASNYNSDIVVRLFTSADGTVRVEKSEATGIECS